MTSFRNSVSVARVLLVALIATIFTACDPCSGILTCGASAENPYLAVDGQIVEAVSGTPIDGARVDLVRRSGVAVAEPALSIITAGGGYWRAEFTTTSVGFIDADITITTPGGVRYTATGIRLTTSAHRGDANVLDRWADRLSFPNAGELYERGTNDTRIVGALVEFHRTGGVHLIGPGAAGDVVRSATDFGGRVPLFSSVNGEVLADSIGKVIGDLIVRRSATDSNVISDVSIPSSPVYRGVTSIIRRGVGPSLAYAARFVNTGTRVNIPGVEVSFERTSGIELASPTFKAVSDAAGKVDFSLEPKTAGVVQGRLIYRAPLASSPDTLQITLPTFEADTVRFYGAIRVRSAIP